ncbi:hypothetical protein PQQ99_26490 [Paraburkholderia sediminicola]|uniref:Uncharacterized protein n=1 Tax=Paraburkholderia metrosideri TaxID=580937 RepID=A0ABW9E081_9BURK
MWPPPCLILGSAFSELDRQARSGHLKEKSRQSDQMRPNCATWLSLRDGQIRRNMLAKSTMRGNREVKKPKQPKKVISPAAGVSLAITPKTAVASAPAKKK